MKKTVSAVLALLTTIFVAGDLYAASAKSKADKDTDAFRYDVEYANTGANGMLLIKVWSYSKKANIALEQCKKNAVHGVIFKGYTATGGGSVSQKPLARDAGVYSEKQDFFASFFVDGGQYMKYVSAVADGSAEVRKVGKEYKTGVVITVNKDQLRKDLEDAGIIKGLASGF
jgi:hypothetical protein